MLSDNISRMRKIYDGDASFDCRDPVEVRIYVGKIIVIGITFVRIF